MRIAILFLLATTAIAKELDGERITKLTGVEGKWNAAEAVYRIARERTFLPHSVDGSPFDPWLGLTSWVAFHEGAKAEAMLMGDLVLLEAEINPVLSVLLESGIEVTALHNHFLLDQPKVTFLHVGGEGALDDLANGIGRAFRLMADPPGNGPRLASSLSPAPLRAILGQEGATRDGMFKMVLGRTVKLPCGCEVGGGMGITTWAAFGGSDEAALVCGDFACFPGELQGVLGALRRGGLLVTAIHNHMTDEEPRTTFVHYWGRGKAAALAAAVRATLDAQAGGVRLDFEGLTALPRGFRVETTNPAGPDATWEAREGVLALTKPNHDSPAAFNLCWSDSLRFRDGAVEARVRADAGEVDQGGGVIWRARDKDNYYLARYNPLEKNFRLYHVTASKRTTLGDASGVAIADGAWFTIRIVHKGARIEAWLDGKKLLEAEDATFPDEGGVGFWTKADAATSFDDLVVTP
ncbi:MAG: DUF1259 domain-containing protein [Planctomycetaceae bacterium]